MKIIVCLKPIIDPDIVEFDIATERLSNTYTVLDHVGRYVLEEGLALKEKLGGEVIAVSVAPEVADEVLKNALLVGAGRAVRLWHESLTGADTWLVSQAIKKVLDRTGFDLVLCGARSGDTGSGLMVSALAHHLNIASATGVISLQADSDKLVVHKKLEKGKRETYSLKYPAVLGLEEGVNEPRYVAPFSRAYREGMRRKLEFLDPGPALGEPLIRQLRFSQPRPRVKAGIDVSALSMQDRLKMMRGALGRKKEEIFEGPPEEAARKVFDQLKENLK